MAKGSTKLRSLHPPLLDVFRGALKSVLPSDPLPEDDYVLERDLLSVVIQGDISQLWVALAYRLESSLSNDASVQVGKGKGSLEDREEDDFFFFFFLIPLISISSI